VLLDRRTIMAATLAAGLAPGATAEGRSRVTSQTGEPTPYAAVALQLTARSVEQAADAAAVRAQILAHIADVEVQLRSARIFIEQYGGAPVRLAVLPEYLFTSYPGRISVADFAARSAIDVGGPEYAAIGAVAQRLKLFLAGNAYERDRHFPGFYFQTSFVADPAGAIVLRYRRLISMFAPSPHDLWDRYLDRYGLDGVFPVARTEIGNLAAIASEEILYPEIARAHALRGAEVFVHSSSEIGSPLATQKDIAKRARAFENLAYVVSANTAGISGTGLPLASADGNSQVIDWKGRVLSQSSSGETFTAFADIDMGALRTARRTPGMVNYLARQRPGLFAPVYAAADVHRPNGMLHDGKPQVPDRDYFPRAQAEVIARMDKAGLI
jgi:predicted amidohydrolase